MATHAVHIVSARARSAAYHSSCPTLTGGSAAAEMAALGESSDKISWRLIAGCVPLLLVDQTEIICERDRLLARLPEAREILRGSLLERTMRHRTGCPKCERGEGHPAWILAVSYPGGRIRQISLRKEQVPQVRRWLGNYRQLKAALEEICELNQQLLRPGMDEAGARRRKRD